MEAKKKYFLFQDSSPKPLFKGQLKCGCSWRLNLVMYSRRFHEDLLSMFFFFPILRENVEIASFMHLFLNRQIFPVPHFRFSTPKLLLLSSSSLFSPRVSTQQMPKVSGAWVLSPPRRCVSAAVKQWRLAVCFLPRPLQLWSLVSVVLLSVAVHCDLK